MQKILLKNRKATFDYEILNKFEVGMVLRGHEAKSLRSGGGNLKGSFVSLLGGEAFIKNFHIPLYEKATLEGYEPERPRKLLLRKAEILKLTSALNTEGVALIPLVCGLQSGKIKLVIALARGKKNYDKRHSIKNREQDRSIREQY